MWPFRPETLTEVLTAEDIRELLRLGADVGSVLTVVERAGEQEYVSIARQEQEPGDSFCAYFRHGKVGGKPAFAGADETCDQCEQRLARRLLDPAGSAVLPLGESGVPRVRCHMGLTDCVVPIRVGGKTVAALIGGRRVGVEEDRQRIRKSVGKIGKLTKAELEGSGSSDRLLIQPADESARERLVHEIPKIPLASPEFDAGLEALGGIFSRIATGQYEAARWARDEALLESAQALPKEAPRSAGALQRCTEVVLKGLRDALSVEFLTFYALLPRQVSRDDAQPSLVAESGLGLNTARKLVELEWARLPAESPEPHGEFHRALGSATALTSALSPTPEAPRDLKDKLTKCFFLAPVSLGSGRRAALGVGLPRSTVTPQDGDHVLLLRLARALTRWYYSLGVEVELQLLSQRLHKEEDSRKRVEEARRSAELKIREAEAARREEARRRGFTHFDFCKLMTQCLENVAPLALSRGVEFDSRALSDRVMFDGDRQRISGVVEQILTRCVERTAVDAEGKKPAPVRLFIKRGRESFLFGAEAIGHHFTAEERRRLFARDVASERRPRRGRRGKEPTAATAAGAEEVPSGEASVPTATEGTREQESCVQLPPTVGDILAVVRRHQGRFRIESERLHRFEKDPHRWIGRTAFLLEFRLPVEKKEVGRSGPGRRPGGAEKERPKPSGDSGPEAPEAKSLPQAPGTDGAAGTDGA